MYKSTHRKRKAKSNSRAFQMASAIVMYSWQGFEHYQETEQHQRKRALPHCNSIRAWNIVTVLGGTAEALCTNIRWVLKYPDGICWTCNSFEIEPTIEWDEQDCHCYLGAVHIVTSSTYMWLNIIEYRPSKGTNWNEHSLNCNRMLSSLPVLVHVFNQYCEEITRTHW